MHRLIFLDLDGVVHETNTATSPYWERNIEDPRFFWPGSVKLITGLCEKSGANIVVTSAWRLDFSVEQFNEVFEGHVVGTTPETPLGHPRRNLDFCRYQEVIHYLAENRLKDARWVAIDDQEKHFPARKNIFFTHKKVGITEEIAESMLKYLTGTR